MVEEMNVDSTESTVTPVTENKIVRGKPKSGRIWKEPRKR